jgi:beta-N-acetylhexosaminidase
MPSSIAAGRAPSATADPAALAAAAPTLAQLIGQKLMVAMSGTVPSAALLGRVQRGEVGGIILFGSNIGSAQSLVTLTSKLRAAASAGGQPPLLIATDQEGGAVRRVPWAPPTLTVPAMGSSGSTATAASQGKATATVLRCAGIDLDLAPVADLPASTASILYRQGRTWSFDASTNAAMSDAFASGLELGLGVPSMKHFPGLGFATADTDTSVVTIGASAASLADGLKPYQAAIAHGLPMVMLSNATYSAYDALNAAGWSRAIGVDLLRGSLGFTGVTITDSLTGTAAARGVSPTSLAIRAAQAGTDMILVTGSETSTQATYGALVDAAVSGSIPGAVLRASYDRIVALKAELAGPVVDRAAPAVAYPRSRLYAPSTVGATTVPVRTDWAGQDPCAISAFALTRKAGSGSWTGQALPSTLTTSLAAQLTPGTAYRYAASASDGAGNRSGWAYGPTFEPFIRQESSGYVKYAGSWGSVAYSGYSGGRTRYSLSAGASASYTFAGTSIGWVSAVGPTRGSARVYLDGVYQATVNLYSSTTALRRVAYAWSSSSQGTHTIRIVVVGTVGHPRVDVDAFVRLYRP